MIQASPAGQPLLPVLVKGGTVVTVDAADRVFSGDVLVEGGRITALGPDLKVAPGTRIVDARGCIVSPGFVQAHVHLCQVLFRGFAEELPLMPWLKTRIWPLEAAHSSSTLSSSARLGIAELLLGGTTAILDMGTVNHHEAVFEAASSMGIRMTSGKAMMDKAGASKLDESTSSSLSSSNALADRFHKSAGDRLRYAYAPRFILSCTDELLRQTMLEARARGCLVHTHASENPGEVDAVKAATGTDNVTALHERGVSGVDVVLAHCVHLTPGERAILKNTKTRVVHCPSANLKLASGTAPVPGLLSDGVVVGLGADGAPCNNRLSAFSEMRLAALLQKPAHGADAMPARVALRMATMGSATAMGRADDVGSLEIGKRADIVVTGLGRPHLRPVSDPIATLVYAAEAGDVVHVFVDGQQLVRDRRLVRADLAAILDDAERAATELLDRAGLSALRPA
ncbi:MAG: 5'-deoxyadenosine deaminase [Deltaproteobacteria bacterium]|nr:5'-deoxyadenosine deaminase [Deltaproteobacteria bacterium]